MEENPKKEMKLFRVLLTVAGLLLLLAGSGFLFSRFLDLLAAAAGREIGNPNTYILGKWVGGLFILFGLAGLLVALFREKCFFFLRFLTGKIDAAAAGPWLIFIFLLAFLLRLGWIVLISNESFSDWRIYSEQAAGIARHFQYGYPDPTAFKPPGYALFLGGVYAVFGVNEFAGQVANALLGALNCVLLFFIGKKTSALVGKIASLVLSIYPTHIFMSSYLCSDILFTVVLLAMVAVLEGMGAKNARKWGRLILGMGLAVLSLYIRPVLLLFPVALVFYLHRIGLPSRRLPAVLVLYAGLFAVLFFPWWIRNYRVFNRFIWWGTEVQYAMLTTSSSEGMKYISGQAGDEYKSELELTDAMASKGIRHMFNHPGATVKHKVWTWFNFIDWDLQYVIGYQIHPGVRNRFSGHPYENIIKNFLIYIASAGYIFLCLLFMGGVYIYFRFGPPLRFTWLTIVYVTLFMMITYGQQRLRFPIEPLMIVFAALVLEHIISRVSQNKSEQTN